MKRGGRREGSGRRTVTGEPGVRGVVLCASLPPDLAQLVRGVAANRGLSVSQVIVVALEASEGLLRDMGR